MWRRLLSNAVAVSLMATGLVVLAQPVAHAAADAVVSGAVVDSVTHQPLASVTVTDSSSGRTATTTPAGTYSLSVPAGDHVLTATLADYVPYSTPTLTLTAAQTLTQGFSLEKYASASGTVTEKGTSSGIAAVVVKFFEASSQSPNPVFTATSGPDGTWSIQEVAPGAYKVQVEGPSGFLGRWLDSSAGRDSATTLTLAPGERRSVDSALPRGTVTATSTSTTPAGKVTAQSLTGGITGRVTIEPGGTPAANTYVTATTVGASVNPSVLTDANGVYSIVGLAPGYYRISAELWGMGTGVSVGYLGGAVSSTLATYISIGSTTLTGQDIHLQRYSSLSGTLTEAGVPIASTPVDVVGMGLVREAYTAPDGTFTVNGIPPGTYRLTAYGWSQRVWWNGALEASGAAEITVPADSHLTGYVLDVPRRHALTGVLRSAGGAPLPNVDVAAFDGSTIIKVTTDQNGTYGMGLPDGTYELGVVSSGATIDWSPGSATPVLTTLAADVVRDLTVPDDRAVTVTVVGADGVVPASFSVYAYNSHNEFYRGAGGANGSATISLPPGPFRLEISVAGYRTWTSEVGGTSALSVPVTLALGGSISGSVGAAAFVTAINVVTGEKITQTSPTGTYAFAALPPGDYVVTAAPYGSLAAVCGPATWLGGTGYASATRLHVVDGTSLTGKNFAAACQYPVTLGGELQGLIALPPGVPASEAAAVVVTVRNSVTWYGPVPVVDGAFSLTVLTPGTYEVTALHAALGLEGHATVMVSRASLSIFTVTMVRTGLVSGRVIGPQGEAVPSKISSGANEIWTDGQAFSLGGVSFGSHTLKVEPLNMLYAPTYVDVTVGPGADVVGLAIHVRIGGTLSGTLPSSAGSVEVTLVDATGRVIDAQYSSLGFWFDHLPPGPVKLRFSGAAIVTEWWRDATDAASATAIDIPEGGGVADIVPGLQLAAPGASTTTITGTVTMGGNPLQGVTISTTLTGHGVSTTTLSNGTYSLTVPRGSTYQVRAAICLGPVTLTCAGQDYSDVRDAVATGTTVTGVDFVVPLPAGSFTSVTQPVIIGRPAVGATLSATVSGWVPTPDSTTWQWYANGVPIYGATSSTVVLSSAEAGSLIQVIATQAKAGYATITLPSAPTDPVDVAGAIHALTPSRLLDSRVGLAFNGPAVNGTAITLPVWGRGGVPQGASAVLVNLTVTQATAGGFLTAYASGGSTPTVSNANFVPGATIANLSLVPIGADGAIVIKVGVAGSVQVIADVQGYIVGGSVSAAGAVVPVTPTRLRDTRATGHLPGSGVLTLPVAGVAGVPADATAVVVNITVTGPTGPGYLTAWPAAQPRPTASNVNFVKNQTVPNMAIVKVGDAQSISIFNANAGQVDVVVDIQGYITAGAATLPGTVKPITPTRVVDTRIGLGAGGPVAPNYGAVVDFDSPDLENVPQGALINLTAADPRASGWLAAYPYGVDRPGVSNLNFTAGAAVPNLSLVTLGDGYGVLYNGSTGTVQMVADVLAYVLS